MRRLVLDLVLVLIMFWLAANLAASVTAQTPEPLRIGATVSLSGKYQEPSAMVQQAYRLWEREVNARGGLLGRPVQLILYDDQSQPNLVRQRYEQLMVRDKVDLLLSPYGTPLTLAASEVTERHRMVMLAGGASGEELWERGYRNIFGVYAPARRYFIGFLDLQARHGLTTLAVLAEKSSFNLSAARGAQEWAARFGIQVVLSSAYQDPSELPRLVEEVKKAHPDSLILCAYPKDSYALLSLLKQANYRPRALAMTITPVLPDFYQRAGPLAEGVFAPSQWEPDTRIPFPGTREFIEKFTAFTQRPPSYHAGTAYAACQLMEKAVTATKSLNQEKIREFILSLDTVTVIGRFNVNSQGLQVGHNALIIQWQQGKKEIVYPTNLRTAPPRF